MAIRRWLDNGDNWTTATDWSGGAVPGAADDVQVTQGNPVATAPISINSITDSATVRLQSAGASSIASFLTNSGTFVVDTDGGTGGTTLSIGTAITNTGSLFIGNGSLSANTTVTAASLSNTGTIELDGSATKTARLTIQAAAGFGTSGTLSGTLRLFGRSIVQFASGSIKTLSPGSTLRLDGSNAFVAITGSLTSNSALTALTTVSSGATLQVGNGASVAPSGSLTNYGTIALDNFGGQGGASMTVGATLSNNGFLQVGNGALSSNSTLTTNFLYNRGTIELDGNAGNRATINVTTSSAKFSTKTRTLTGTVRLFGNSLISFNGGSIDTIVDGATLRLDGANAFIADAGSTSSNSALTGLNQVNGTMQLGDGASVATTGNLTNSGTIAIDNFGGQGGSSCSIGNVLTNDGYLQIGNGALSSNDIVSAGFLKNRGTIELDGSTSSQAVLKITQSGIGVLTGTIRLFGNSRLELAQSQIASIAAGASLRLDGGNAFVDNTGSLGTNSALRLIRLNSGTFQLGDGATVSTQKTFDNRGTLQLDNLGGQGGSSFTIGTTFTNSGYTGIGNGALSANTTVNAATVRNSGTIELSGSTTAQAALKMTGSAGFGINGTVTGAVHLFGNSLLQFGSGQITKIDGTGTLRLDAANSHVAIAGQTSSNSALTGLEEVDGTFQMENGSVVSTSGALTNYGVISLDIFGGNGGASLGVGGAVDNEGLFQIGNGALSSSDSVTATSFANEGTLSLSGNGANRALLNVASAAGFGTTGELTGAVSLFGNSLIEFALGSITQIDAGASLRLDSSASHIANASSLTTNSALTGLSEVDGTFQMENGSVVSTSGPLTNHGTIAVDIFGGNGGASLTIGGDVDNQGIFSIGQGGLSSSDLVAAASFANEGSLSLSGNGANQAHLDLSSAAGLGYAGEVTGAVSLFGNALLEFASGSFTTIDAGASLRLDSSASHVANSSSLTTNSALTGLKEVDGTLQMENGSVVATSGALTNYGNIGVDAFGGNGGASLSVNGRLDNENNIQIGQGSLSSSDSVSATSLLNNGTISLNGNGANKAQLNVSGTTTNNGSIALNNDNQVFTGAITGTGTMSLSNNSTLEFDTFVGAAQTIDFNGADRLNLHSAQNFGATIKDFSNGDSIDLSTFGAGSTFGFAENNANTGGILTVTQGANVAKLNFSGVYTTANFAASADGAGGTLFTYT